MDEAIDRILEMLEQMEAKRRCDEKIDRILEKLDEIEANRSKATWEMITANRATSAILKATLSPTPMAPPPPMPTKCSTICSSSDAKADITVAIEVTCVTSVESSMELVATDSTTGGTHINTPDSTKVMPANCSTVGLGVKGGADFARVTCQTMMGVPEGVLVPDASSEVFSPWLIAEMDPMTFMVTKCLMKCLECDSKGWATEIHDQHMGWNLVTAGSKSLSCHHSHRQLNPGGLIFLNIVKLQEAWNYIEVKVPWLLLDQARFKGVPMDYAMVGQISNINGKKV
uniref:Uncharacterized protein n=1 Tax=Oryza rufipogon TaxID=4529 RepID=A0A0E0R549_ORYRU